MILAVSALLAAALAQVPITLPDARQQARANTQALLSEASRRQAEAGVAVARAPLLPQVTAIASAGGQYAGTSTFVQNVPEISSTGETTWRQTSIDVQPSGRTSFGLSLQVNQSLYDASRWAALAQAGAQAEAARGQEVEDRTAAELEAIRRFYELLKAQRTQLLLQDRVKSSEELLARARALFTAGRMKKEEEISAAVNLGTDKMAVLRQQAAVSAAQASLAAWLARPPTDALVAQDPGTLSGEARLQLTYDQAMEQSRAHRALLQASSATVRAARSGVEASSSGYLPSVSAYGRYDRNGADTAPFFTDPTKQNAVSAGLNVTWNAFSGFGTEAQVSQARAALARAELSYAQAERDVGAELRRGLADLDALSQIAAVSSANLDLARDGLTLATSRFEAGDTSTLQVRDAQVKLTQAEVSLLESRVDVEIARAALERSMGTLGASP
ncbi:MAG TPA: TolC family protein [Myxococcales bacterium]|nr:TolC family protein [Myxococcales bacterium]